MAGSVNKVILIGNLGRDPEIRALNSGAKVANLRVATSESWRDKATGERKERTEWHRIVVFNEKTAEFCEKYLKKGDRVYVEGSIETRKWADKDGKDQYTTEIVVRPFRGEINSLSSRRDSGAEAGERTGGGERQPAPASSDPGDEIPF